MKAFNKHRVLAAAFPDSRCPGAGFAANRHATGSPMSQVIFAILVLVSFPSIGFTQSAEAPTVLTGEQVVDIVSPSVVLVLVGEGGERASRQGSGVIVRPEGVLLTAYHVVKGARQVQVKLKNGEVFDKVDLIATDDRRDVAAMRISARGLRPLSVAKVEDAKPGEAIYVVSNPEGLGWTASSGVLSATRPADEVPGAGKGFRLIQFSAPASPGSSGGALVGRTGPLPRNHHWVRHGPKPQLRSAARERARLGRRYGGDLPLRERRTPTPEPSGWAASGHSCTKRRRPAKE